MQKEAELIKKGFQLFQIIDRNLRSSIPKETPWLPKVTSRDHLIYQELQTMYLYIENESINTLMYIYKYMPRKGTPCVQEQI